MSFLIYGANGWIGSLLVNQLLLGNEIVHIGKARIENQLEILKELEQFRPKFVINVAGKTGRPNVDWCEDNKQQTIRSNVLGAISLADACWQVGVHLTFFSTGCIYEYSRLNENPTIYNYNDCFTEQDPPNFFGSFYSKMKIYTHNVIENYNNVLMLRLRMPISNDWNARNFIVKILRYPKVVNIPNSMTVLSDLLPIAIDMTKKELKGVWNFTNIGAISHNEILQLYKEIVDNNYTWTNFSIEEQDKILKCKRSNNQLDVTKLTNIYPQIKSIKEAVIEVLHQMKQLKNQ
eukprot:TRINITY_DN626_c1_g5_i1.p1 TRINITY_DN626_c1_g5~~TRINITY_DN626_c1_g5_i1.p1  ORF type:complete len:291 (+),score=113.20 TRINITY_DN626_c1_g5_i1:29-901(+)